MLRYLEIKLALMAMVEEMKPGDRLPARTVLAKRLDTTRTTLDKAISELQNEKILYSEKGSGTYVASMLPDVVPQVENWGVMVPSMSESIYSEFIRGIELFTERNGINLVVCSSNNSAYIQEYNINQLMASIVKGFIIVPTICDSIEDTWRTYHSLIKSQIPFVFCNRQVEGIPVPTVASNDFYGGYIATKYLIEKGYRHIGFLSKKKRSTSLNRFQGYVSALAESGMTFSPKLVNMNTGGENVYEACRQLLTCGEKVDAIFCFNDYIALDAYRCIRDMGLRISRDIGIIGYDAIEEGENLEPSLTSVSYRNREIGEKAAEILWGLLHTNGASEDLNFHLFQPDIIVRESCTGPEK